MDEALTVTDLIEKLGRCASGARVYVLAGDDPVPVVDVELSADGYDVMLRVP